MAGNSNSGQHLKGGRIEGSGRAPGTKNQKTTMMDELMSVTGFKEKLEDGTFITPAVFWASIINDETRDINLRHDCAKSMAPYFYKKMPQQTETTINVNDEQSLLQVSFVKKQSDEN